MFFLKVDSSLDTNSSWVDLGRILLESVKIKGIFRVLRYETAPNWTLTRTTTTAADTAATPDGWLIGAESFVFTTPSLHTSTGE